MSIGPRNYVIEAQIMIEQADNVATAQQVAEQAMAAIGTTLAQLGAAAAVSISADREEGAFVFSQG